MDFSLSFEFLMDEFFALFNVEKVGVNDWQMSLSSCRISICKYLMVA